MSCAEATPEKDVGPAWAICVRHHTDNVKAEATIEGHSNWSPRITRDGKRGTRLAPAVTLTLIVATQVEGDAESIVAICRRSTTHPFCTCAVGRAFCIAT